jgi:hypothetical protein
MQSISFYLEKFKTLGKSESFLKQTLIRIIEDQLHVTIPVEHVTLRGEQIFIQASPVVKSEIFMKKETIQTRLQGELSSHSSKDIR